jgi:hypothetical protein
MSHTQSVRFRWDAQHEDLLLELPNNWASYDERQRTNFVDKKYDNWVNARRGSWELNPAPLPQEQFASCVLPSVARARLSIMAPMDLAICLTRSADNLSTTVEIWTGTQLDELVRLTEPDDGYPRVINSKGVDFSNLGDFTTTPTT